MPGRLLQLVVTVDVSLRFFFPPALRGGGLRHGLGFVRSGGVSGSQPEGDSLCGIPVGDKESAGPGVFGPAGCGQGFYLASTVKVVLSSTVSPWESLTFTFMRRVPGFFMMKRTRCMGSSLVAT